MDRRPNACGVQCMRHMSAGGGRASGHPQRTCAVRMDRRPNAARQCMRHMSAGSGRASGHPPTDVCRQDGPPSKCGGANACGTCPPGVAAPAATPHGRVPSGWTAVQMRRRQCMRHMSAGGCRASGHPPADVCRQDGPPSKCGGANACGTCPPGVAAGAATPQRTCAVRMDRRPNAACANACGTCPPGVAAGAATPGGRVPSGWTAVQMRRRQCMRHMSAGGGRWRGNPPTDVCRQEWTAVQMRRRQSHAAHVRRGWPLARQPPALEYNPFGVKTGARVDPFGTRPLGVAAGAATPGSGIQPLRATPLTILFRFQGPVFL